MFILYAVIAGVVIGLLVGGRLEGLASLDFRWAPLAITALILQLLIFGPFAGAVGPAGIAIYIASTLAVLIAVVRNIRIPGLGLVAIGAASNLAAILANGGVMPADPGAAAFAGLAGGPGFSNSAVLNSPALAPLTDIFALPAGLPLANVFSVGDVLIGLGIGVAIAIGMRRTTPVRGRTSYD